MTAMALALTHDLRLPFPLAVHKSPSHTRHASSASSPTASGSGRPSSHSTHSSPSYHNEPAPSIATSLSKYSTESQRTSEPKRNSFSQQEWVPPPYVRDVEPPSYTHVPPPAPTREPRTLPMYMFILGFACPLLWLVGTFMMRGPHRHRNAGFDPYASLSPAEKATAEWEAEQRQRRWVVETKWSKRCMWATVAFVFVGLVVGMSVWGVVSARKNDG